MLEKRQLLGFAADLISKGCECLSLQPRTVYKTYYHTTVVSYHLPVFDAIWGLEGSADYFARQTVTKTYGKTTVCSPTPYT